MAMAQAQAERNREDGRRRPKTPLDLKWIKDSPGEVHASHGWVVTRLRVPDSVNLGAWRALGAAQEPSQPEGTGQL